MRVPAGLAEDAAEQQVLQAGQTAAEAAAVQGLCRMPAAAAAAVEAAEKLPLPPEFVALLRVNCVKAYTVRVAIDAR